jgi:hypothetical protein
MQAKISLAKASTVVHARKSIRAESLYGHDRQEISNDPGLQASSCLIDQRVIAICFIVHSTPTRTYSLTI